MRSDLSDFLVHWIKGDSDQDAFEGIWSILTQQQINGGTGGIKGQYSCICFTEAPETVFHKMASRYTRFGIRISKRNIFEMGGRPAIYQPDSEFELLPESLRWRHVRYEPNSNPPIDFTWEREWRILDESIPIDSDTATVLLPSEVWKDELEERQWESENERIRMEAFAYGKEYSWQDPQPIHFGFHIR